LAERTFFTEVDVEMVVPFGTDDAAQAGIPIAVTTKAVAMVIVIAVVLRMTDLSETCD
jgi:hypothetical protein